MTFLLDLALRMSAPAFAALLACRLLRRGSAALRHRIVAAAVVAVVTVVLLSVALPSWDVPLPRAFVESFDSLTPAVASGSEVADVAPIDTPLSLRELRAFVAITFVLALGW
jgi:hypothetical protein